jgi:hypothetical protein
MSSLPFPQPASSGRSSPTDYLYTSIAPTIPQGAAVELTEVNETDPTDSTKAETSTAESGAERQRRREELLSQSSPRREELLLGENHHVNRGRGHHELERARIHDYGLLVVSVLFSFFIVLCVIHEWMEAKYPLDYSLFNSGDKFNGNAKNNNSSSTDDNHNAAANKSDANNGGNGGNEGINPAANRSLFFHHSEDFYERAGILSLWYCAGRMLFLAVQFAVR